ncbi:uncharacterized protein BJ171DRAFT_183339 [Polychytrium aggregatum]|uniref:uncharacterized protein n=1 Tax=Polychytrium aggregatum TaxID=110093 RepID=UPI0022FE138B|nr:uncharacterized protein BJ171DRAFT_183339 [Polychytrium aggregatum]KAI9202345.1 hypothetical protein BJ171DRAFT_183339 [Polychytrium aggregatum]
MFVLATNQYSCLRTMHTDQTGDRHCYHGCRLATGMLPLVYRIEDCGQVNSAHNSFSLESEMAAFKRTAIDSDSDPVSLAYARYDILSPPESDMIESSISLECQWKSPPSLLSPPSMSASLAVHILHVNGEADAEHHNPTSMLRKELDMIRSWGVGTEDPSQLQFFGKGASMSSLIDRFLDDAKSQGFQISNFAPTTTSLVALGGDPLPSRSDADFVEKIWELVVNHCSDLSDFQDALTSVISELEEGKLLPMIHRSNHTGFGQQIRECLALSRMNQLGKDYEARKQMVQGVFDTYLENPGDCLLEIGVWKLKRDYTHHLIGNDLANWGDLEFFLDASHGMSQQILLLQCLHQVVELWTLLKDNFLILPLEHMKVVVKGALDHYKHMMQDILADDELGQSEALQRIMENTVYNVRLQRYGSASIKLLENMQQGFDPSIWSVVIACTRSGRAQAVLFSKDNMLFDGDRDDGAFQMDTDPAKDWTIHSAVDSSRQWNVTRAMRCL